VGACSARLLFEPLDRAARGTAGVCRCATPASETPASRGFISDVTQFALRAIVAKSGFPTSLVPMTGSTTMSSTAAELKAQSWPTTLARPIRQGIARIAARRELRRSVKELMALDDRILRDIGLKRSDIEHAARFGRSFDRYRDRLHQ
jgi:uncharacterized protein YjiS (DUF1127 family)